MSAIMYNIKIYFKEYLASHKKVVMLIFCLLVVGIGISITLPLIVSIFIDNLSNKNSKGEFFFILACIYLSLLVVKIVVEMINSYISERLGWTISNKLRADLVKHCLNLDFSFHQKHKTGELIERVDGDVTFLANFFSMFFVNIVGNALFVVIIIYIFYMKNIYIGLGYSLLSVLAYFVFLSLQDKITQLWSAYREDEAQLYGYIQESVASREDIIGIGEERFAGNSLKKYLIKTKHDFIKAVVVSNIPTSGFFAILNFGDLMAIGVAIYLFCQKQMTIGSIYLISNYIGLLNRPFISLRYELENLQKIGASLNRISELFNLKSEISYGKCKLVPAKLTVEVKNVSFSYGQLTVLKNISFHMKAGETIGIVGRTGSGKTTLIKLLAKMYDADKGQIFFNNISIEELDIEDFYKHICFISQNSTIFNGTVYENLTCFDDTISRIDVLEALEMIGLADWVANLPEGIETVIDHSMMSSGQEQLLHIGKAFLTDAKLYIFDEINSKLDDDAEEKIFQALHAITAHKSVLLIVHKLKLLELVDKVLILENGEVKLYNERKYVSDEIIERNLIV